jgi:hypothetical protein
VAWTENVGVVSDVRLSTCEKPVSLATSRSGVSAVAENTARVSSDSAPRRHPCDRTCFDFFDGFRDQMEKSGCMVGLLEG